MAISDWPATERPREKLLHRGAKALTDAELLAIFLRTGVSGKSAVDLALELLSDFKGLRNLLNATQSDFCSGLGLGQAKYAQLQAVLEMAARCYTETLQQRDIVGGIAEAKQLAVLRLSGLQHEVFAAFFLDTQHRLIQFQELFIGTIDGADVYPREVAKQALKLNAAAVIFAHNHPSGCHQPSQADHQLTRTLIDALDLLGVRVLDHLIVGQGVPLSFAEKGWL